MPRCVIFDTPGLIDLRSFTVHGFNAKPNTTNPIGFFGTGLKFTVAVLLRMGIPMWVWIGDVKYVFYLKDEDFRGKSFQRIYMRREKQTLLEKVTKSVKALDYTTEFGKTWELWMVFRELESNTRDENGTSYVINEREGWGYPEGYEEATGPKDNRSTRIVIESDDFAKLWYERSKIFLDPNSEKLESSIYAEIIGKPGTQVYYRGQRAHDLPEEKPSLFTYNIVTSQELTEDRTLKSTFSMMGQIASTIAKSDNEELIEKVLLAPDKTLEKSLDFSYTYVEPSEAFKRVVARNKMKVSRGTRGYVGSYGGFGSAPRDHNILKKFPMPWAKSSEGIRDKTGNLIFSKGSYIDWDWGEFDSLCDEVLAAMEFKYADDTEAQKITDARLAAAEPEESSPISHPATWDEEGEIPF